MEKSDRPVFLEKYENETHKNNKVDVHLHQTQMQMGVHKNKKIKTSKINIPRDE